jgi:hypothetical protein
MRGRDSTSAEPTADKREDGCGARLAAARGTFRSAVTRRSSCSVQPLEAALHELRLQGERCYRPVRECAASACGGGLPRAAQQPPRQFRFRSAGCHATDACHDLIREKAVVPGGRAESPPANAGRVDQPTEAGGTAMTILKTLRLRPRDGPRVAGTSQNTTTWARASASDDCRQRRPSSGWASRLSVTGRSSSASS